LSLVIVGSVAFDTIQTPRERREKIVGGSGTYCSLAASFFAPPKIVAVVGKDFPRDVLALFKARKIDTRGLEIRSGKTFHWEGHYGEDPNQRETIRTELNVFEDFHPTLPDAYRSARLVFLANIDPDLQDDILSQVRSPEIVAMDTIKLWIATKPDAIRRVLGKVDILFVNDEEVRLLTGEPNLVKAARLIRDWGPRLLVAKKGEHGALVFGRDFVFAVPGRPSENVVDPTGAGDSFAGGFLGYLDKTGKAGRPDLRRAAVYGSVLASFAIEDFGIERLKAIKKRDIESRYREFHRLVSF
jgi:sugar/nucleoside kinase (ribokinase family)